MKHYLSSSAFIIDLISVFPFESVSNAEDTVRLLKFFKIIRLFRMKKLINRYLKSEGFALGIFIFKNFVMFLVVIHWICLLWFTLGKTQAPDIEDRDKNNTWIPCNYRIISDSALSLSEQVTSKEFYNTKEFSRAHAYIYSYYSMVMIILGGEITPVTTG